MDASTRSEYDVDDLIAAAGTFAPDPEEGEIQAVPAVSATSTEQAKGFQGDSPVSPEGEETKVEEMLPSHDHNGGYSFPGDEEHVLIHDINKAFAKETKAKLDAAKTKETLAKSKEAASNARIEAGKKLIEASKFVPPGKWGEWCRRHVRRSVRDIRKVMKLAGAEDPQAAAEGERETARKGMAATRERERSNVSPIGQHPLPTGHRQITRYGSEKAVYDRVMFMVEKAEDEDQLRAIERHIAKVFPELARLATAAGLTGKE